MAAVKAPGFGDNRKNTLKDMAIATGATVFGDEANLVKLEDIQVQDFGEAEEISITKDDTLILRGKVSILCFMRFKFSINPLFFDQYETFKGSAEEIEKRIVQIEDEIEQSTSDYEKVKSCY